MPFLTELDVRRHGPGTWKLLVDLVYEGSDQRFVIPAGYITDYASSPKFMRWLIDNDDTYLLAAIVHDWLITHGIPAGLVTSRDADGIFRRIMREEKVSVPKRWVMWAAVRVAALGSPHRKPGRQFWRDAPLVLVIGLLALPVVGPVALLVGLVRLLVSPLKYWV